MADTAVKEMTIRLPSALHERLKRAAEREHRSLHGQMIAYIERGLAADERKAARTQGR